MVQCGRRVWHGRRRARHCRCPRRVAADVCQFCKTNDIKTLFFLSSIRLYREIELCVVLLSARATDRFDIRLKIKKQSKSSAQKL